ncbi:MAG TPA: hypothetical protein VK501_06410 [Baekduia sp.]|uniref:hypothetical protein n=1 Tax=Baekduia sp. TaxID=2600305 RepID=UPI002B53E7CA|nr:hypothetical protein [Baekduia sp.]HMJ33530.1 hypothetical protein [Baekduia sp.]
MLACAGGATAASTLITGKQIENSSLTGADIRNASLSGDDLDVASIGPSRLSQALVEQIGKAATPGPAGPPGAPGPAGAAGATGPSGPSALASIVVAQGNSYLCSGTTSCSIGTAYAACPAGTKPLGGGVSTGALNGTFIGTIATSGTTNGYMVAGDNFGASSSTDLLAFAYCSKDVQSISFPNGTVRVATVGEQAKELFAQRAAAR